MYFSLFIDSSIKGYFGCFHILAIMNKAFIYLAIMNKIDMFMYCMKINFELIWANTRVQLFDH